MAYFNKKNKYQFWHSPLVLVALFLIVALFAYNMIGLIKKEHETNKNKVAELNKINDLRKRESALSQEIDKLNTDQGVEESIRDKFQVVKPGEKMIVIVDKDTQKASSADAEVDHSFWGWIKRFFSSK